MTTKNLPIFDFCLASTAARGVINRSMIEFNLLRTRAFIGLPLSLGLTACASTYENDQTMTKLGEVSLAGAWVSSDDRSNCATKPITYFSTDGTVLVFLNKDGDMHSFGQWSLSGDTLTMTHNDFPLDATGTSNDPVALEILQLDDTTFTTRNAKDETRIRTRCADIELNPNDSHSGH